MRGVSWNTSPAYGDTPRSRRARPSTTLFQAFSGDTTSTLSGISSAKLDLNNTALIVTATIKSRVKGAAIFVGRKKPSAARQQH